MPAAQPHEPAMSTRRPVLRDGILHCDLCVIGAGSGGLVVAGGAAQMGASVVLIERHEMGGDCLNTGCVPSKALIAAAHVAHAAREARSFGVSLPEPEVDFAAVHRHVHGVIAAIAPNDSQERFEGFGCTVIRAHARFTSGAELEAGAQRVRARRFVVATGSSAAIPPIPGLAEAPHLTNESVFGLTERPGHLVVLGGGPIGCEMAQAFRRLGAEVTLVERGTLLPRDEPEAAEAVRAALTREGVAVIEGAEAVRAGPETAVELADGRRIEGTHLLVAAGRKPTLEGLGLDAAGVAHTPRGITVDARLRSTNPRILAVGDVAGGPQFTHAANYMAGIAIRNAVFGLPAKADFAAMPWVTYTDPEVAHVGLTEAQAREKGVFAKTLHHPLHDNDRAQAERSTEGFAKLILGSGGRVLGATLVAPRAGEMLGLWELVVRERRKIGSVAGSVVAYPTMAEIGKRAAGEHYLPSLFSPRTRWLVGLIQRWLP
jgi:pyruvate/2-oxoglutarate dehydrogenase complex dihydrolipoamide dehydrogenase (E3) component